MKKLFIKVISLIIVFIIFSSMVTFSDKKTITVLLNGEQLTFDVHPTLESGRTLVPMRVIFEALGATVDWDNDTFTAIAVKDDVTIKITIDDMKLYKNHEVIELDVPARLIDGRTLVPARAVSEGMGAKVDWDNDNYLVIITTKEFVPEPPKKYSFDELSNTDLQKLDASYETIRYSFEQHILPNYIFNDAKIKSSIKNGTSYTKEKVDYVWRTLITQTILNIQMMSESEYAIDEIESDKAYADGYTRLVRDTGYMYYKFFSMGYESTTDGNTVFIINFKKAVPSVMFPCKYIGIVLDKQNNVRYFTAETDFISQDKYFLFEVNENGIRTLIELISMDKNSFCNEIDKIIK